MEKGLLLSSELSKKVVIFTNIVIFHTKSINFQGGKSLNFHFCIHGMIWKSKFSRTSLSLVEAI